MVSTGVLVPLPIGTMNITTHAAPKSTEDSSIHGRALPALVLVRSISWPATRLPATISIADSRGNSVRNRFIEPVSFPSTL